VPKLERLRRIIYKNVIFVRIWRIKNLKATKIKGGGNIFTLPFGFDCFDTDHSVEQIEASPSPFQSSKQNQKRTSYKHKHADQSKQYNTTTKHQESKAHRRGARRTFLSITTP
jgi:hypothetical protein